MTQALHPLTHGLSVGTCCEGFFTRCPVWALVCLANLQVTSGRLIAGDSMVAGGRCVAEAGLDNCGLVVKALIITKKARSRERVGEEVSVFYS